MKMKMNFTSFTNCSKNEKESSTSKRFSYWSKMINCFKLMIIRQTKIMRWVFLSCLICSRFINKWRKKIVYWLTCWIVKFKPIFLIIYRLFQGRLVVIILWWDIWLRKHLLLITEMLLLYVISLSLKLFDFSLLLISILKISIKNCQ